MRNHQDSSIRIFGAREHNLRNLTLELPRDALIVFCGVSGSGKSSLAHDTLYAEGQRRYVESLSASTRQLLGELMRPAVDHIDGLSPAIAIDQSSSHSNPRSTVGTLTDIYDYLRVLFAKVGQPHCYECGEMISARTPTQICDDLMLLTGGTRLTVLAPQVHRPEERYAELLRAIRRRGYARVRVDGELQDLAHNLRLDENLEHQVEVVIDRLVMGPDVRPRLAEAVELALEEGCSSPRWRARSVYSSRFACPRCGITYPELTPHLFSFNHPAGYCPNCGGLGVVRQIAPGRLIRDREKSVLEGALHLLEPPLAPHVRNLLEGLAEHYHFDLDTPWTRPAGAGPRGTVLSAPVTSPCGFTTARARERRSATSAPLRGWWPGSAGGTPARSPGRRGTFWTVSGRRTPAPNAGVCDCARRRWQ